MPFDDSDIYKIIEGASYSLQTHPDEKLDTYIDEIITKIAAAQEKDGYICTWKTIAADTTPASWVKPGPPWFDCSCCPSNIARFMPSIPDYIYAVKDPYSIKLGVFYDYSKKMITKSFYMVIHY
jgi:DUF1680 family protein